MLVWLRLKDEDEDEEEGALRLPFLPLVLLVAACERLSCFQPMGQLLLLLLLN
jgi:hypothetical protein